MSQPRAHTSVLPSSSSAGGRTWQVVKPDHLVDVLVVRRHLREEGAFGDAQHGGLLGDIGLGRQQVALSPRHRAKQGGASPGPGREGVVPSRPWPETLAELGQAPPR